MQDKAIDPKALASILGDDISLHMPILNKFVVQTEELLTGFETAYADHDVEQVRFHAHKFKSSARTVGANKLADLCLALETAARSNDWTEISALVGQLRPEVERVRVCVAEM